MLATRTSHPLFFMAEQTRTRHTVAIAGNPNAGKTSVFNALAGTRHKVGNYPGVTVESIQANVQLPGGDRITLVDLPGCYSLTARSLEEQIAHEMIFGRIVGVDAPSLVLDVVDASNLERNLYLTTQLLDQGIPVIVVLNMVDIAPEKGVYVEPDRLSETLGCPVIPTVGRKREGITQLLNAIESCLEEPSQTHSIMPPFIESLPPPIEEAVSRLSQTFVESGEFESEPRARAEALWALLSDFDGDDPIRLPQSEIDLTRKITGELGLSIADLRRRESEARYAHIGSILEKSEVRYEDRPHRLTEQIDAVLLHRFFGPVALCAIFAIVFQSIFSWAGPGMDAIDTCFSWIAGLVDSVLPESLFKGLILDGVLAGVGNTVIFLPQILILFFFLSLLEDSGYLARAAFLLDRLMASIGLTGKAFVPLLSSFACAIPGIMAARTISSRKDRLVTILIAPLMACSARLPVYILIIGTVFPAQKRVLGVFNLGGLVMLGLYLSGIVGAVLMAWLFKRTLLKSPKPVLVLEMPTYKMPSLKATALLLWDRSLLFLRKAGTVILAITVVLWGLLTFPRDLEALKQFEEKIQTVEARSDLSLEAKEKVIRDLRAQEGEARFAQTYGGKLGQFIEPVIRPLGFDWKIGIGLISSLAAREVFVGTMGVIYGISAEGEDESVPLRERLRAEKRPGTDQPFYTPLLGLSLLVFYVFACQCMATIAIVKKETLSWRWPLFLFGYMTALAWMASFAVYNVGLALGYQ